MATFRSIKELTRALQQGSKLLSNMFLQRKTIAVKYADAFDTMDGDENKLKHLITFGVIVQTGDSLEFDDAYQRFFEEVLAVNEDINISALNLTSDTKWVQDFKGNNLLLFTSQWCINWALQKNEGLILREFNRD